MLRTFLFPGATIKEPPLAGSPSAAVTVTREVTAPNGRVFGVTPSGTIVLHHLAPIDTRATDAVAVAERFLGAYLWGGKSSLGIDCSGLVQTALRALGHDVPRDADMQEKTVGADIGLDRALWRRGDLMFWPGHVAFVRDADSIIHANGKDMAVAVEPSTASSPAPPPPASRCTASPASNGPAKAASSVAPVAQRHRRHRRHGPAPRRRSGRVVAWRHRPAPC